MASITITLELDETFIYDVLTNMVESGGLTWAMFSEINRDVDSLDVMSAVVEDREWHNMGIRETQEAIADGDTPDFKHLDLGYDEVVLGIQRILGTDEEGKHVEVAESIRNYIMRGVRESDAGDIDAICCDVIAQAALFGELVYA